MATKKRNLYLKNDFSDEEVYNEIRDQIKEIRDKNLTQVQEECEINNLYMERKKEKKRKKILQKDATKIKVVDKKMMPSQMDLGEDDE